MQKEVTLRVCSACEKALPLNENHEQHGYYCCDEYYCNETCLATSFEGTGTTWNEHYSEEGDCYYTEWEWEELEAIA